MEAQWPAYIVRLSPILICPGDMTREHHSANPSFSHDRTMAQAFSASLDSAFSLDTDVTQLSQTVDQKYVFSLFDSVEPGTHRSLGDAGANDFSRLPGDSR